jgi:DNA repair photolyase
MALNKSKGNMYPFVTHTWNAIKGECPHRCSYCYMRRWGKQPPLHFDEKELQTDLGKGNFIFVGSSCDMWAEDAPYEWIVKILWHTRDFDNKYLFQTRNVYRLYLFHVGGYEWFPEKYVIATTLETNRDYKTGNAPPPINRAFVLGEINAEKHITVEPVMDFDLPEFAGMIKRCNPAQVNIGADSGRNGLPEPPKEKLLELIAELETFTKVVKKKNLLRLLK